MRLAIIVKPIQYNVCCLTQARSPQLPPRRRGAHLVMAHVDSAVVEETAIPHEAPPAAPALRWGAARVPCRRPPSCPPPNARWQPCARRRARSCSSSRLAALEAALRSTMRRSRSCMRMASSLVSFGRAARAASALTSSSALRAAAAASRRARYSSAAARRTAFASLEARAAWARRASRRFCSSMASRSLAAFSAFHARTSARFTSAASSRSSRARSSASAAARSSLSSLGHDVGASGPSRRPCLCFLLLPSRACRGAGASVGWWRGAPREILVLGVPARVRDDVLGNVRQALMRVQPRRSSHRRPP